MEEPRGPRRFATSRRQGGLTLIETLVAMAILAVAVVGIAYGFSAVVEGAGAAQLQAKLDGAAQTAADYVQSDVNQTYHWCTKAYHTSAPSTWDVTYPTIPWPPKFPVTVSASTPPASLGYPGKLCRTGVDYGLQEITVTVADGSRAVTLVTWKSEVGRP